ncbi:Vascular endothelial growth factor receptor 3 [Folsomia candida]|uniref:Vascular endothelial growth factor receptor 3 n=1 Tax=Folsomia candida TaxID=158441 RepID=A0A226DH55_FOLCA|nr:Vascular endothelial growth factor receptor 3 [Folsomia candida]
MGRQKCEKDLAQTYQFRQPCLGLYLQGGVKSIAIMELGIQLSMLVILSCGIPGHLVAIEGDKLKQNWTVFYMRSVILTYYYFYICTNIFLTRKLYTAAATRDVDKLMSWLIPSMVLYLFWFATLLCQTVYIGLVHITGAATWWSFTTYKLYSFWVAYSFIREIKRHAGLNFILQKLTDQEIDDFLKGSSAIINQEEEGKSENFQDQPYRREIEIDINRVKFDDKAPPLGSGAFGKVLKAHLLREEGNPFSTQGDEPVAVKTVSPNAHAIYFKALLSELKVLSYIGRHENIVNLVGACTSALGERQLFVIVEFCSYGSMLNYLRGNRCRFSDTTAPSRHSPWEVVACDYVAIDFDSPTTLDLIKWSMQTAKGMEYIARKKVIHGDLAARNVLLTGDMTAKISDFGLSHQLYDYSYFVQDADIPLPWKWISPEGLKSAKLSTQSDVWSFGITIWEYFSLGAVPYGCWKTFTNEFIDGLRAGDIKCERPPYATDEMCISKNVAMLGHNCTEQAFLHSAFKLF